MRVSRWLIFAPVAVLAILAPSAVNADGSAGLSVTGYHITNLPPTKSDDVYEVCGNAQVEFINATFDYPETVFEDCGWDWFMLHYTGSIEIPEHDTIELMVAADDGGTIKIGVHEFGDWNLKGCSWSAPISPEIAAGVYPLDGWFYEAGGSTCFMLAWRINNGDWEIVPPSAFTSTPTTTTTTTTTTLPEVTTSWVDTTTSTAQTTTTTTTVPSTTAPATTTTTTTLQETSTTTTTTTVYVQPWVPPATTEAPTTTTEPEPTTTTEATPDTTIVDETVPATVATITTPDTQPETPDTTLPEPDPVEPEDLIIEEPVNDDEPAQSFDDLQSEQAIAVATSAQVLQSLSAQQATEVFAAIDLDEATPEQIEALVEAVQDAPAEVREAFETQINIFDGKTDNYVPLGSAVSVGARRVLVAATAIVIAAPMSMPSHTSRKNG